MPGMGDLDKRQVRGGFTPGKVGGNNMATNLGMGESFPSKQEALGAIPGRMAHKTEAAE